MHKIRDFICLDVERLKSILSQIDEGVIETAALATTKGGEAGATGEGSFLGFLKAGGQASLLWQRQETETRTLHDHIYDLVERALTDERQLISIPGDRTSPPSFSDTSFILVTGRVLVNDFAYMKRVLEKFNDLSRFFARTSARANTGAPKSLQSSANQAIDPNAVKGLQVLFDTFYGDRVVIKVTPFSHRPDLRFVGTIQPLCLREDIHTLIHKYGSAPNAPWHMFAQVAAIPDPPEPQDLPSAELVSVDDAFSQLFSAIRKVENIALSVAHPEVAVTPIAVYRS